MNKSSIATIMGSFLIPLAKQAIGSKNQGGDCYEAAGPYILNRPFDKDLVLVHGEVMGRGELQGVWFGHAWIESGDEVIEVANGKNLRMPKHIYYILGTIDQPYYQDGKMHPPKNNVLKYTGSQAMEMFSKHETFGPWELETETGY
jgi:hypothetical protein